MVFFDGRFENVVEMFEYIRNFGFYIKIINRFLKGKKLYVKLGNKWGKFRDGQLYKKASCLSPINMAKPYQNLNSRLLNLFNIKLNFPWAQCLHYIDKSKNKYKFPMEMTNLKLSDLC